MPISVNIRADIKALTKNIDNFARKQMPFATALALAGIAKRVAEAEAAALPKTFDRPTPFTMRAFGVKTATKASPTSTVFIRDIQAAYLEPYIQGGKQVLKSGQKAHP